MTVTYNDESIKFQTQKSALEYYSLMEDYIKNKKFTGIVMLEHNNRVIKAYEGLIQCDC